MSLNNNPSTSAAMETNMETKIKEILESSLMPFVKRLEVLEKVNEISMGDIKPSFKPTSIILLPTPIKPVFSGRGKHPLRFLEDLRKYLTDMNILGSNELSTVLDCLTGHAKNWSQIYINKWTSFAQFESDFLEEYWGRGTQSAIRLKLINGCWDRYGKKSLTEYFSHFYREAKGLMFYSCEDEIVNDIMKHFPEEVQRMWITLNSTGAVAAIKFLRRVEDNLDDFPNLRRPKRTGTTANVSTSKAPQKGCKRRKNDNNE